MSNKNSISVIIPCHNGWHLMGNCLESIKNQTNIPYEVIIIDDCSTDETFTKLTEYALDNKNIKVIHNSTNLGPGLSRKVGINSATGEYLAFCDCDDWFEEDFIENLNNCIQEEFKDLYLFDNYNNFSNGKSYRQNRTNNVNEKDIKSLLVEPNHALWRLVAKRVLFKDIFYSELRHEEDLVIVLQLILKARSIRIIDEAFYHYFIRTGSLSMRADPDVFLQQIQTYTYLHKFFPEQYIQELEHIGVRIVCYSAVLYALRSKVRISVIKDFLDKFEEKNPDWYSNKYNLKLGYLKRIFLFCVKNRMILLLKLLSYSHSFLFKLKCIFQ